MPDTNDNDAAVRGDPAPTGARTAAMGSEAGSAGAPEAGSAGAREAGSAGAREAGSAGAPDQAAAVASDARSAAAPGGSAAATFDPRVAGRDEREAQLRWLMLLRIAAVSAVLGAILYIHFLPDDGANTSLRPLFWVVLLAYSHSLLVAVAHRLGAAAWRPFAAVQLAVDVVLETLLVYFLGGMQSPFIVLYLLTVAAAGIMLTQRSAMLFAAYTAVGYGAVGLASYTGLRQWLPIDAGFQAGFIGGMGQAQELYLRFFGMMLTCFAVAWLSSTLARRARETGHELRARESELASLQELNTRIIRGMSSGLLATDVTGTVIILNGAAEEITGRDGRELTGAKIWKAFGDDEGWFCRLRDRLKDRRMYRTERRIRAADGETKTIGMTVTRIDEEGGARGPGHETRDHEGRDHESRDHEDLDEESRDHQSSDRERLDHGPDHQSSDRERPDHGPDHLGPARQPAADAEGVLVFMFRDLTEIRRLEQELRLRERMAVLGEMAGSIAHEIRNPLASISGSLQLLDSSGLHAEDSDAAELIQIVVRESKRLSKTLDDFLEYARPGKLELEEVDLEELAEETLALLRNSVELRTDHVVEIDAERAEDGSFLATVDPSQIKQVFWNLARNAIQAMPRGGRLRVALTRVGGQIEVCFEDQGEGMKPEEIETVFQPYISGRSEGTGLGLSIVYKILERHGAGIEVDSEPGQGTRILISFKAAVADPEHDQLLLLGGDPGGEVDDAALAVDEVAPHLDDATPDVDEAAPDGDEAAPDVDEVEGATRTEEEEIDAPEDRPALANRPAPVDESR